jgi:multidrug resistance efflux pump
MTMMRRWRLVQWLVGGIVLCVTLGWLGVNYKRVNAGPPAVEPALDPELGVACFGHVDVKHGITSLYPTQPGRVAEVLAEEDQMVKAGALLLRLEDTFAGLRIEEARADLEAAQIQLVEARKLPQQHQARIAQMKAGIEVVKTRLASAQSARDLKEDLVARELIKKLDLDIAQNQVKEAEAMLQAEGKKLVELQLHDPETDVRRAAEEVKVKESRLRQAQEALKECGLRAPSDGKVMRVLVGRGEMLGATPRQPAIQFCPDGPRFIRAEVDQEFAYRVKVGAQVVVRDDSNDSAAWRGRVTGLSDWYTRRRSILQEPMQFNDVRTLECIIALDPDQQPLRIGQRVRVLIKAKPS